MDEHGCLNEVVGANVWNDSQHDMTLLAAEASSQANKRDSTVGGYDYHG